MNKRTRLIMMTVIAFFIATAFIVWFVLSDTPATVSSAKVPVETPSEGLESKSLSGPCRGDVYGMIYEYDTSGKCVPVRCESGYTKIGGQCIFDGADTSNLVNNTRVGRVGWRLGKMRF